MPEETTIDVGTLIDNRKLGKFHLLITILCALVVVVDGLDFGAGNVSAPAVIRAFHADKSAMGVVFGAGYFGILVGSIIFGYVGDRFGRRAGAIGGVLAYSIPALIQAYAGSLNEIMIWRFVAGLGIGGVIPNVIALVTETAPQRYRASFVVYTIIGYSIGTVVIGQVAAAFIPHLGWQVVFFVAGTAGIVLSAVLYVFLPESIRFLALARPNSEALRKLVARIAPELSIGPATTIIARQERTKTNFSVPMLFRGDQRLATPLLWVAYFAESLTYMTLLSWMPVILESTGLSPAGASLTYSYAAACGVITQLSLARPLDVYGPLTTVATAIIAVAAILYLGTPGLTDGLIIGAALVGMAFCGGAHNSLNCTVGIFYPTGIRANGVGFATGMGRVAAVIGPVITGFLMAQKLPLQTMLYIVSGPYIIVMVACLPLGWLYRTRFRGPVSDALAAEEPLAVREHG
ncbi:MAG TPA: MFS transporter [Stellaceae bacterium]|nr:MFS transporter [Stellaceae bacterium]